MKKQRSIRAKTYVGGYLPSHLSGHLALYSIFYDQSRAALIEQFITETLATSPSPKELCDALAMRLWEQWGRRTPWTSYLKHTSDQLNRKKVPREYIDWILTKMRTHHAENRAAGGAGGEAIGKDAKEGE